MSTAVYIPPKKTTPTVAKKGDTFIDPAGRSGIVGFDTKTGKALADGESTEIDTSTGGKITPKSIPATIVTSGKSKAEYANNANALQAATNNIKVSAGNNPSVTDFLTANKMPSDYNSRATLAKQYGIEGYTGSASQNTQLIQLLQNGGSAGTKTDTTKTDTVTAPAPEITQNDDGTTTTANADGTSSTTQADGTGTITNADGTTEATIPPALKKQYDEALVGLDEGIAQAKATLEDAKKTLAHDPAATNAIDMIMAKYDQLVESQKEKNAILLGSYAKNGARTGMMQYANEMYTNFMSEEHDKANQRVADLLLTESQEVLKAQQAYKDGDVKAFSTASKAYQDAQKDKISAINDLLTQTDKIVKEQQADVKAAKTAEKDALTSDIKTSTAIAKTIADTLAAKGIKDSAKVRTYINAMAEEAGIANADILQSAVIKAQQDNAKVAKTLAPKATGSGSAAKFNVSNGLAKVNSQMQGVQGDDHYIDPNKWIAARQNWGSLGGVDSTFVSNFKKYLNPESYSLAGIK